MVDNSTFKLGIPMALAAIALTATACRVSPGGDSTDALGLQNAADIVAPDDGAELMPVDGESSRATVEQVQRRLPETDDGGPLPEGYLAGDTVPIELEALDAEHFEPSGLTVDLPATVGDLIDRGACSTGPAELLNAQLAEQLACNAGDVMEPIDGIPNVVLGDGAAPLLQRTAAWALRRVAEAAPDTTLEVTSSWRSVAQQYVLWSWQGSCGVAEAATPGTSNHESGLAVDLAPTTTLDFREALVDEGFRWHSDANLPHHDYIGGASDLGELGVLSFQQLWNHAHPEDRIAEDGLFDDDTESRLRLAPLAGFAAGTTCEPAPADPCATFDDVASSHPLYEEIENGYAARLWESCSAEGDAPRFCPDAPVTRAELAVVLARTLDLDIIEPAGSFSDVPDTMWEAPYIEALDRAGELRGCGTDPRRFCPDAEATRADVAAMLVAAMDLSMSGYDGRFRDLTAFHWATRPVEAISRAGLTSGCAADRFCPDAVVSRQEMALFVVSSFEVPAAPDCR